MAENLDAGDSGLNEDNNRIIQTDLRNEMSRSYLEYAMSVIVGRALPDARDGLKPVHRRILYAMYELGLTSSRPYRKCARVVGEVLGKYHPHGDTAVYDALVRMAQDFSMRMPLIDGHGNFGSVDNDPPAAMRYTESRLQSLTDESLLEDIESETVDFSDNFDGSQQEPTVLPARIPQLLLNGSSGIAIHRMFGDRNNQYLFAARFNSMQELGKCMDASQNSPDYWASHKDYYANLNIHLNYNARVIRRDIY